MAFIWNSIGIHIGTIKECDICILCPLFHFTAYFKTFPVRNLSEKHSPRIPHKKADDFAHYSLESSVFYDALTVQS